MAKATGLLKDLSGKVGTLMFSKKKSGKTSVYVAPEKKEVPTRTKSQMLLRLVWINLAALFTMFNKTLKRSHESLSEGLSDYNEFISDNTKLCRVYLSKTEFQNGGCILAPVQITRGKLPSIGHSVNDAGVLVTDIALGGLVIDAETTVSDFTMAVMMNNDNWEEGDQVTFFYGQQLIDAVTSVPRAKIKGWKMKLDPMDETPLLTLVSQQGFTSVGGYLGMNQTIVDGAAAWIHSREDEEGNLRVSTQRLYVDTSVLASYMGEAAFDASVQSYGGLNGSKKAFLRPDEDTNRVSSGSQSGSSGSPSTGSGTSGSGAGGNTGGSIESTVVAAPTFSGETQFTETTRVTMSGPAGAQIRYTLDGSTPSASSTLYSTPITLSETTTVKAVAIKDGVMSSVTSRTYSKVDGNGGGDNGDDGFTS